MENGIHFMTFYDTYSDFIYYLKSILQWHYTVIPHVIEEKKMDAQIWPQEFTRAVKNL